MCTMLFRISIIVFSLLFTSLAWAQAAEVEYAPGLSPLNSGRPVYTLNLDARLVTQPRHRNRT